MASSGSSDTATDTATMPGKLAAHSPSADAGRAEGSGSGSGSALDRRYHRLTQRIGSTPGGRIGLKVVVFVVGLVFVLGGIGLAVFPGPLTIPPILVGVYVWSLEFGWAYRLRGRVNRSAREAWTNAKQHPARALGVTALGLAAGAVAVWAVVHYDLITRLKDLVG